MLIEIIDETNHLKTYEINHLKKLIQFVFRKLNFSTNLEVIFVSEDKIKELNSQYRNKDSATDILTFNLSDEISKSANIFICINCINPIGLNNLIDEISWLLIHGLLHLKGFTHETNEKLNEMLNLQHKLLNEFKEEVFITEH